MKTPILEKFRQRWQARRDRTVPEAGPPTPPPASSFLQDYSSLSEMESTLTESEFGAASLVTLAVKTPEPGPQVTGVALPKHWLSNRLLPALLLAGVLFAVGAALWQSWQKPPASRWSADLAQLAYQTDQLAKLTMALKVDGSPDAESAIDASQALVAARTQLNSVMQTLSDGRMPPARLAALRESLGQAIGGLDLATNELQTLRAEVTASQETQLKLQNDSRLLTERVRALRTAQVAEVPAWTMSPQALGWAVLAALLALLLAAQQWYTGRRGRAEVERVRVKALTELEQRRAQAQQLEQEAKRINDATQAAILRLMDELQLVAEGDLTQQATVTEDITGAIADSVNYTVEELRTLVGQVQRVVQRVTGTTAQVENTSIELLATSNEQLREIRETGQAVLDMSGRINQVSVQAQSAADEANQARLAAESGAQAVQDAIGGMNTIREQIQETAKRIKRLGESSQEIGEITELISDITEQTNVLALNAAIQAASAGEAGRGFSVVAEEVQRLAERSADATRQIAALVRAIQGDTQDAVLAMELSTREVVAGARLSDNAGAALADIDHLSRQVAELIEQIAQSTAREADLASQTAGNIQHIFAVTEQTGESTRSTVQQVRDLTRVADELRQSVARFKIA